MTSQDGKRKSYLDPITMDALEIAEDRAAQQDESVVEGGASWANANVVLDDTDESLGLNQKGI